MVMPLIDDVTLYMDVAIEQKQDGSELFFPVQVLRVLNNQMIIDRKS